MACRQNVVTLENGTWRGTLMTDAGVEIPFNFEVYDSLGKKQVAFINGKERLNINEVYIEGDSVFIKTPLYDAEIRALLQRDGLTGRWVKRLPDTLQRMVLSATPHTAWRFTEKPARADQELRGKWSVMMMKPGNGDTTFSVGEFTQNGNSISGTFLTNYGDYRFLSGEMNKNNIFLSGFDGSGATLFTGTVQNGLISNGKLYSGPSYQADWSAKRDADAMLADAFSLTVLKKGYTTVDFQFPDLQGDNISPADDRYKGKVIIIQFLGSWCPNCMDETAYLSPLYDNYEEKGLAVIGLAYERYADREKAGKAVANLKKRFNVRYPILLTGCTNKTEEVLKSIPALANFSAFPTTILIDKRGTVRSIHTGFSGPATGQAYLDYKKEFEGKINALLAE